jgi:hypothetical protein
MGDRINISRNSGTTIGNVGSQRTVVNGVPPTAVPGQADAGPGTFPAAGPGTDGSPRHGLYAFADIVGYSKLSVRLQKMSQDDLVSVLNQGLAASDTDPGRVSAQDQGDARLLAFPPDADTAKVLAIMPRVIHEELAARNADMAPHAHVRVRLAFAMGASLPAGAGLAGAAPIAAARLANSDVFRQGMRLAPRAQCGLLIDGYLYSQWVRQGFRTDLDPRGFASVRVRDSAKGFDEPAWLKLFGYAGSRIAELLPATGA